MLNVGCSTLNLTGENLSRQAVARDMVAVYSYYIQSVDWTGLAGLTDFHLAKTRRDAF